MKKVIYLMLCLALISCSSYEDQEPIGKLSKLDNLIIKGVTLELEQVYIMNGENTIPCFDIPKDSSFKSGVKNIRIDDFVSYDESRDKVLTPLISKEKWVISPMKTTYDTTYIEHGYGSSYVLTEQISKSTYNILTCYNELKRKEFSINITINDIYNYRGNDNHFFMAKNIKNDTVYNSNLYLEVLTKDGDGIFYDKYIYLDTNPILTFSRQITAPLTGDQVKIEISKGNYTLYLYNGLTTYKIGNNLYIPRYNSYVYIGTVNTNGMVINLESKYYRLKFKIV